MSDNSPKYTNPQPARAPGRGRGFCGGRGGRGARGNYGHGRSTTVKKESLNSDEAVPMLKYGPNNNYDYFKKKMITACMEKYKHLGRIVEDEKYSKPPEIDRNAYNLNDEFDKTRLADAYKTRDKEIHKMNEDKPALFAYILSKISKESRDEIERHDKYKSFNGTKDPLELWLAIKQTHQTTTTSKVESIIKKTAKDEYHNYRVNMNQPLTTNNIMIPNLKPTLQM
jgi:hypothetical protein